MKTKSLVALLGACAMALSSLTSAAAVKVRLIYGKSWSAAGRVVCKSLSGPDFRNAAKGQYILETVDESDRPAAENLGTLKLPAIFVISESGNCFLVIENVPHDVNVKKLMARIQKVDQMRQAAEKEGFRTADQCGEFLQKFEKFVGGPRRVVSKGFYDNVFETLKKLDPKDETGWQRHFTFGCEFNRNSHADGLEIVEKANWYREKKDFAGGEAFVTRQQKELPAKHLSLEQKQSLLMARFALYRDDTAKREELISLLQRTAAAGEDTFWGTAALGWLNIFKVPPLSVYWGWHQGDFKGPKLNATFNYGVGFSFPRTGRYTVTFVRDSNSSDAPRIETVHLLDKKGEEVAVLSKPQVEGTETRFEFEMKREHKGRIFTMAVRGTAGAEGNSSGQIRIVRSVLRPRKEGK